jgi:Parvulin-like peptidyl-prolyl isomerase
MTPKPFAYVLLVLAALLACVRPTPAADGSQGIAAVVNDDVISVRDLQNRVDLVIATSNFGATADVRQKITPEVLRLLIDERLKRQEASRLNVTVSPRDIEQALQDIGQQLGVSPAQVPEYLQSHGAAMPALLGQLESEIAWIKAVSKMANERSSVSDEEVEEEIQRLGLTSGGTEYRVSEIFLPVDDAANEASAMELAGRIVQESRSGANFAQLARTFSQSTSAEAGGDLGWIRAGQLGSRLDAAVQNLTKGEVSNPIRTETGIYILQLGDRRTAPGIALGPSAVRLSQIVLPLPVGATQAQVDEQLQKARALRGTITDCDAFAARGKELGSSLSGDLGRIDVDKLPPQIRQIIDPLAAGQVSDPIRTGDGVVVLMVCERENVTISPELRASVQRRLFEQRMLAVSRQTLRDLRRTALIDVRI